MSSAVLLPSANCLNSSTSTACCSASIRSRRRSAGALFCAQISSAVGVPSGVGGAVGRTTIVGDGVAVGVWPGGNGVSLVVVAASGPPPGQLDPNGLRMNPTNPRSQANAGGGPFAPPPPGAPPTAGRGDPGAQQLLPPCLLPGALFLPPRPRGARPLGVD